MCTHLISNTPPLCNLRPVFVVCAFFFPLSSSSDNPTNHSSFQSKPVLLPMPRAPPDFLFLSCNVIYLSIYLSVIAPAAPFFIHIHFQKFRLWTWLFSFLVYFSFFFSRVSCTSWFLHLFFFVLYNGETKLQAWLWNSPFSMFCRTFLSFCFSAGFSWALCGVVLTQLGSFLSPRFPSFESCYISKKCVTVL